MWQYERRTVNYNGAIIVIKNVTDLQKSIEWYETILGFVQERYVDVKNKE